MGQSPSSPENNFCTLPKDVITFLILRKLGPKDVVSCMLSCKLLYECGAVRGGLEYKEVADKILPYAAARGDESCVKRMLQLLEGNVNKEILHNAVRNAIIGGHESLAVNLMLHDKNRLLKCKCPCLLSRAASQGMYQAVCVLLDELQANPAFVWPDDDISVLARAISSGSVEVVDRLLQCGKLLDDDLIAFASICLIKDPVQRVTVLERIIREVNETMETSASKLSQTLSAAIHFDRLDVAERVKPLVCVVDVDEEIGCSDAMAAKLGLVESLGVRWRRRFKFFWHMKEMKRQQIF